MGRNDGLFQHPRVGPDPKCAPSPVPRQAMLGDRAGSKVNPHALVGVEAIDLQQLASMMGKTRRGPNTSFAKAD